MVKKAVLFFILIFSIFAVSFAQTGQMGGVSTGEAKIYTSKRTINIVDEKAPRVFEDVIAQTVLKDFVCVSGDKAKNYILETTACTVAVFDYDNDGKPDIFLLNGSTIGAELGKEKAAKSALYKNLGNWKFEDVTEKAGVANERWGMGTAIGDYDNDGRVDFHITNFSDDSNTLYRNDGDTNFTDVTIQAGLGEMTIPFLGWGTSFLDYDNDGWKDVVVANGHVYPAVDNFQWGTSFAQQILLFRNMKPDAKTNQIRYERVAAAPNSGLAKAFPARGIATADFDGDGRLDFIINNLDAAPALLRNVADTKANWLALKLVGDASKKTPKDAVGSVVYATTGKLRQRFDVISGASYASQNDQTIHIGLGEATKIDSLEIIWANGETQKITVEKLNRLMMIKQNETTKTQK